MSAIERCLYGIIDIKIIPFLCVGKWFLFNFDIPYVGRNFLLQNPVFMPLIAFHEHLEIIDL